MKNVLITILILIGYSNTSIAQDSYKKRYYIKNNNKYKEQFYDEYKKQGKTKTVPQTAPAPETIQSRECPHAEHVPYAGIRPDQTTSWASACNNRQTYV